MGGSSLPAGTVQLPCACPWGTSTLTARSLGRSSTHPSPGIAAGNSGMAPERQAAQHQKEQTATGRVLRAPPLRPPAASTRPLRPWNPTQRPTPNPTAKPQPSLSTTRAPPHPCWTRFAEGAATRLSLLLPIRPRHPWSSTPNPTPPKFSGSTRPACGPGRCTLHHKLPRTPLAAAPSPSPCPAA